MKTVKERGVRWKGEGMMGEKKASERRKKQTGA